MSIQSHICLSSLAALVCVLTHSPLADAAILVHFDQDEYVVSGPGDSFTARISLDADNATPIDDPLPNGLFSFAVESNFEPLKAELDASDMSVPADLDFFGFSSGALIEAVAGSGRAKGNIDQLADPLMPYEDSLLVSLTITNLATGPGSYLLTLDFFEDLGPTEQHFVDGAGTVLDPQIVFGRALVRIVPEPACAAWLGLAFVCCWVRSYGPRRVSAKRRFHPLGFETPVSSLTGESGYQLPPEALQEGARR